MSSDFLKKSVFSLVSQLLLIVVGMASGILVARVLGPTLKGQAALLVNALQMLFMIGGLGLGSSFAYFIARKEYDGNAIVSLAFVSSLVLGGGAILLFIVFYPLHKHLWSGIPKPLMLAVSSLTILYLLNNYLGRIVSAYDRIYSANIIDIARSIADLVLVATFLMYFGMKLEGYVLSLYLVAIIQFVLLAYTLRDHLSLNISCPTGIIRVSIHYGLNSYGLLLINFLNYRIDMFLLKYFKGDLDVGYYSLAVGMAELLWLVPNSTVAPLFNRVAGSQSGERSLLTVRTCRWSLYFLLVIAIFSIFCGKFFIGFLYGKAYLPSYMPFIFLLPGICLFPIYKLLIIDLAARGMPGYGTITSAVALVTNVGLNLILIPRYGTIGAAASSSISYSLMSVLSIAFFMKITGISLKDIFFVEKAELYAIISLRALLRK